MKTKYLIAFFACFSMGSTTWADTNKLKINQYLDFERVSNPQISPDGKEIIYTRTYIDKLKDNFASTQWVMDSDGNKNRRLLEGSNVEWSPDGTRIAYVSDADEDGSEIFVRWMDAEGATSQITHFEFSPNSLKWSPDGKWIAFKARVPYKSDWTIDMPSPPKGAQWTGPARVVERQDYKQDRVGALTGNDHLFVVSSDGGTPRQITTGDWNVGYSFSGARSGAEYDWSPDSTTLIFDGFMGIIDPTYHSPSQIYKVDITTKEVTQLTKKQGTWSTPSISPNGKTIAFYGQIEIGGSHRTPDIRTISIDGENEQVLIVDPPSTPGKMNWDKNNRYVYFNMSVEGSTNVYKMDLKGNISPVTKGEQRIGISSISEGGIAAVTYTNPFETGVISIVKLSSGKLENLVNVNDDVLEGITLGTVEEIRYNAPDGQAVHGWMMYPPDFDSSKKYPMILAIHGGPHGDYGNNFSFTFQEMAANGNIILYTNPRGSTSYGAAFAQAIHNQYPGPLDYQDLMAGVDFAIAKGNVDPNRLFIEGCSGGGILTTWVIGQTNRFKAAASLCPVTTWISFAGQADVSGWVYTMFKKPFWEDPTDWLEHSPLMHVGNVSTPTLMMSGELDMRTPTGEAESYYQALLRRGVPTKIIFFQNEYHGTSSKPSNMLRTQKYLKKWFDQYDNVKPIS
ncbi:MAG: S9 family peptidase [Sphingomonadales bacterium]